MDNVRGNLEARRFCFEARFSIAAVTVESAHDSGLSLVSRLGCFADE